MFIHIIILRLPFGSIPSILNDQIYLVQLNIDLGSLDYNKMNNIYVALT